MAGGCYIRAIEKIGLSFLLVLVFLSCSENEEPLPPLENKYVLDGIDHEITTNMYWVPKTISNPSNEIRLNEPVPGSVVTNLIRFSPVAASSEIEGTYVYSQTGDIGTYDLTFVHGLSSDDYEWYTLGNNGAHLVIEKSGKDNGNVVYRISLTDFELNYGYWDFIASKWVSQGTYSFQFSYEGPIEGL